MTDRDYRVSLNIYSGPLDLLLYLIRQEEVDVYDIPISRITEQYTAYIEALKIIDLNLAGDFLVMAARLMEIKAKMLAPEVTLEDEEEEEDPRLELVRQLIEYKKFKEASRDLEGLARERALRFGRPAEKHEEEKEEGEEEGPQLLDDATIWALANAFSRLMRETGGPVETTIIYDDLPVEAYMDRVMEIVTEKRVVAFFDLFTDRKNKLAIIGTFLGLLELVRMRRITVQQTEPFGEIQIVFRDDAPSDEPLPGQPITQGLSGNGPSQEDSPQGEASEEPVEKQVDPEAPAVETPSDGNADEQPAQDRQVASDEPSEPSPGPEDSAADQADQPVDSDEDPEITPE